MTLEQCLMQCAATPEFVREFDRLNHSDLARRGIPINIMIDDATGKTDADIKKFVAFVAEFIWLPLVAKEVEA